MRTKDNVKIIKIPRINNYLIGYSKEEINIMLSNLKDNERNLINKYFFLEGNSPYLPGDIARVIGISEEDLSLIIKEIIIKMKESYGEPKNSNDQGVDDIMNIINEPRYKKRGKPLRSIYEIFNNYSKEEVDEVLKMLDDNEKNLLYKRYGKDLEHPILQDEFTKEDRTKFYGYVYAKMKKLLEKYNKTKNSSRLENSLTYKPSVDKAVKDVDYIDNTDVKAIEILRNYSLKDMMRYLTPKEVVVICLRLGYIDNKYYSVKAISNFLRIDEKEVLEITKKILYLFRNNINKYIDETIKYTELEDKNMRGK